MTSAAAIGKASKTGDEAFKTGDDAFKTGGLAGGDDAFATGDDAFAGGEDAVVEVAELDVASSGAEPLALALLRSTLGAFLGPPTTHLPPPDIF